MRAFEVHPKTNNCYSKYNGKNKDDKKISLYNFKLLTVDDYVDILTGRKKQLNDGAFVCQCPLSYNHENQDRTPSLKIAPGDLGGVVLYCQSHGGGGNSGTDGTCNQEELLGWFNRRFKDNGTLDRIKAKEQIKVAKANNTLRTVPPSEYRAAKAEVNNRHLLLELDLADDLFDEYTHAVGCIRHFITLLRSGFKNDYIAKELDQWLVSHGKRVFEAKIKQRESAIITSKSKDDLIRNFLNAQRELSLYQAHDGTHPYAHFNNIDPEKDCYE